MKARILQNPIPFCSEWRVPIAGFKWVKAKPLDGDLDWYLVERSEPTHSFYEARLYNPLEEHTGLFWTFAKLDLSRESILEFANLYGALGAFFKTVVDLDVRDATDVVPLVTQYGKAASPQTVTMGEAYEWWVREIVTIREFIHLWELARDGNLTALRDLLTYEEDGTIDFRARPYPGSGHRPSFSMDPSEFPGPWRHGDLVQPAFWILTRELNKWLRSDPSAAILERTSSGLDVRINANCLSAAIWLQFAFAVAGNRSYRTCLTCGRWFQIGPGADMRADAKYCSNACRQEKYRKRKGVTE